MDYKKPVLISIDTEAPCGSDPVTHLIYGETRAGVRGGIEKLMDIFEENGVVGLFFVDLAEAWDYGREKISDVMKCIDKRGHEVGVHIHPDHMLDVKRRYLWQYTKEEQRKMIFQCTALYEECLGKMPLSFRAGRYGANNDTLEILNEFNYKYDMSMFHGKKNCKIDAISTCNKIVKYENITEIPVTSYKSFKSPLYERFDKMDVGLNLGEFKWLSSRLISDDSVDIVSFFVHSFSMLKWRKNCDNPEFLEKEESKIDYMIKYMKEIGFQFINEASLKDYVRTHDSNCIRITDYSGGMRSIGYFINRMYKVIKARMENNI